MFCGAPDIAPRSLARREPDEKEQKLFCGQKWSELEKSSKTSKSDQLSGVATESTFRLRLRLRELQGWAHFTYSTCEREGLNHWQYHTVIAKLHFMAGSRSVHCTVDACLRGMVTATVTVAVGAYFT